jgi:hypothetical protein
MLNSAGLSQMQIESPESWSTTPEPFVTSFSHTIHIINFFTLLAVFCAAVKGSREYIHEPKH